jgi:hypothetical protein
LGLELKMLTQWLGWDLVVQNGEIIEAFGWAKA